MLALLLASCSCSIQLPSSQLESDYSLYRRNTLSQRVKISMRSLSRGIKSSSQSISLRETTWWMTVSSSTWTTWRDQRLSRLRLVSLILHKESFTVLVWSEIRLTSDLASTFLQKTTSRCTIEGFSRKKVITECSQRSTQSCAWCIPYIH